MAREFERELAALRQGDHLCMIYEDAAEQMAAIVPFIKDGLARGECCGYIVDDRAATEVIGSLAAAGLDIPREVARGALLVLTKRDTYLRAGRFDPGEMIAFLRRTMEDALARGFTGLRVTGEMTWALGPEAGCDRLIEYEARLNEFFPGSRALAICQYNRCRFPPAVIHDVLRTHPIAILGRQVCPNLYYEPPDLVLAEAFGATRVDWMIGQLHRARAVEADLVARTRQLEAVRAIITEISRELALPTLLGLIHRHATELVGGASGVVFLWDEEAQVLVPQAWHGLGEWVRGMRLRLGEGCPGIVAQRREGMIVNDHRHSPQRHPSLLEWARIAAVIAEPLLYSGRLLGVVTVNRDETGQPFTERERKTLGLFADQAAIAIENARLFAHAEASRAALEVRALQQAAVAELGQRALAGAELQPLLDEAAARVAATLGVEYCQVLELLPGGDVLLLRAGVGWKDGLVGRATVGAGTDSQAGYTLISGGPVVVEDLRAETRFTGPALLRDQGVVSGLSVVIRGADCPFGVLGAHTARRQTFSPDDVHFIEAVANVLAAAIARAQAEAFLRESEARFHALARVSPVGIFHADPEGHCVYVNERWCEIAGLTPEQARGDGWARGLHPADQGRIVAEWYAAVHQKQPFASEYRFQRPDGVTTWVFGQAAAERGPTGEVMGYVGTITDITERKRAEEALRASEEKHRIVLGNIDEIVYMVETTAGNPFAGTVRFVSPRVENIIGYRPEEFLNDPGLWFRLVHPDDVPTLGRQTEAMFTGGQLGPREYRVRHKTNDEYRWMEDRVTLQFDQAGRVVGIFGVARDVTQRKRAEVELLRSQEQLRALAARIQAAREEERTRIAREVHDELGQALTGLKMDLAWLAGRPGAAAAGLPQKLAAMEAQVDSTIRTVRRIATELRPGLLDTFGLEAAIEWQLQEFEARAGIRCAFTSGLGDRPLDVQRATAVFRILQETLTNVARHARARSVAVRLEVQDDHLVLEVRDDGRGITPAELADPKALGILGMRERALALGGAMTITGVPGEGTAVVLSLPLGAGGEVREGR